MSDDSDWNRAAALFDEVVRLADEDDGLGRKAIVDAASASDEGRYDVALRLAHDISTITTASGTRRQMSGPPWNPSIPVTRRGLVLGASSSYRIAFG